MFAKRAIRLLTLVAASAALTSVGVASADADWATDARVSCVQQNWPTVKAKYDPLLNQASPADRQMLQSFIGPDGMLIDEPSADQIRDAAARIPSNALDTVFAGIC
ncbi:hypothetical protein [Nocardia aurantia]|uniref:Hemophore-related protein n=1 Tax=Nocardia aurantia TaxID=2585199 RepID=A0A7K0E0L7_9NOCA|nr:hypothetical protein [Nocardia aurantia]MQY31431.1 hypothetical protein [Nocardia aurantia]